MHDQLRRPRLTFPSSSDSRGRSVPVPQRSRRYASGAATVAPTPFARGSVQPVEPTSNDVAERQADEIGAQVGAELDLVDPIGPGELSVQARTIVKYHLGVDLKGTEIRSDSAAQAYANGLGARAVTDGNVISLASDCWMRPSSEARSLLGHELTHAAQQRAAAQGQPHRRGPKTLESGASVACKPKSAAIEPLFDNTSSFTKVWAAFRTAHSLLLRSTPAEPRVIELAQEALRLLEKRDDCLAHGLELAEFFLSQGMAEPGMRALRKTREAWKVVHVGEQPGLPKLAGVSHLSGGPEVLIPLAEREARAGRHARAFELFGTAYQLLSWQASEWGPRREATAAGSKGTMKAEVTRVFEYPLAVDLYGQMRRILGFYRTLEAEEQKRGNSRMAAYNSGLSLLLYLEIRDKYAWGSDLGAIAEVQRVTTNRGDALRIFGANQVSIDVTHLPGLELPREVGAPDTDITYQHQSVPALTEALFGQTELLAELQSEPAITAEFGDTPIDFNNLNHRLRVWRTMYQVYQSRDTTGFGALHSLMSLIGRYLRAYTVHTQYNIDDFGTSYLANEMRDFPTDFANRTERDCGAYALTVAYEVYRTARSATPRLAVGFRLFAMTSHVVLIITDQTSGQHYMVNNNHVSPPLTGNVMDDVVRAYAPIAHRERIVTPAMEVPLGSTSDTDATFRRQAWSRYQDASSWGIHVPRPGPNDTSTDAERQERAYREFYAAQRLYDEQSSVLNRRIDALSGALAGLPESAHLARLQHDVPAIRSLALRVGLAFESVGPFSRIDTTRRDPALAARLREYKRFLFLEPTVGGIPPLVRSAMVLLYFEKVGGSLSREDNAIVALVEHFGDLRQWLDQYRSARMPMTF